MTGGGRETGHLAVPTPDPGPAVDYRPQADEASFPCGYGTVRTECEPKPSVGPWHP